MGIALSRSAALLCLLATLSFSAGADTPGPPAPDEAQKLFDDSKFAEALAAARRSLAITGTNAIAYDRHALFMLAAESQLHLKQSAAAIDMLHAAQKDAEKEDHAKDAAEAIAFATLIQNSPNNTYIAKGEGAAVKYDILDKSVRHQVYEALFADEKQHCEAKIQAAYEATSLAPIIDVAKLYTMAHAVDLAAAGNTKRSEVIANEAEKWATNLITQSLNAFDRRITRIQTDSNVNALGKIRARSPAGISPPDIATLHQIISDCQKIPDTIALFKSAFARPDAMAAQSGHAKDIADRANTTLQQNRRVGNGAS